MVGKSPKVAVKNKDKAPSKVKPEKISQKAKPEKVESAETPKAATPKNVITPQTAQVAAPQVNQNEPAFLKVRISGALFSKLKRTAQEEGLSIDEMASELITEGVTLRAWEIIERKAAMRSDGNSPNHNQNRGNNFHRHNNHKRGGGGQRHQGKGNFNNNVLDDRASFMEYVRNQDPNRR